MQDFLLQATIYLTAAVILVPLATRFKLGSVLGYLAAGLLIGPILNLVGSDDTHDLQHFAEFGVVMMLFLIGLELEPRGLWDMRHRLLGLGGMQVVLTTLLIMGGAMVLGLETPTALAVGMILALSSTAIVMQTLNEKNLTRTSGGRATFSVLLTQDMAVIPMLALLPLLATEATPFFAPDGSVQRGAAETAEHSMSLVEGLPGWAVTLVTLAAVGAVILAGRYLTRPLFHFIHSSHLREMFTAVALLIVVGIAILMIMVGVSPALGTFLAGVMLANSEFQHELEVAIEPFKGLLLGLFFMTVGAGINLNVLFSGPFLFIGLTLALTLVKMAVLYGLSHLFKLRKENKWLFTLGLAQAGEFGFVLISFALQTRVLDAATGQTLLLVIALSMMLTPLLFILQGWLSNRMKDPVATPEADEIDELQPVILCGVGRFGQVLNRMLQMSGYKATILDNDLYTVNMMRKFGFKCYLGDPTRPELLRAAGLGEAKILIAALDDKDANMRLVKFARRERPDLHIVARARDRINVYELYAAGADDIVRELFDSSLRAARYVLENLGLSEFEAHEREVAFYRHDRQTLRELADLWDPNLPLDQNKAYMDRARALNKVLETVLSTREAEEEAKNQTKADAATTLPETGANTEQDVDIEDLAPTRGSAPG